MTRTASIIAATLLSAGAATAEPLALSPAPRTGTPRAGLVLPKPGVDWRASSQRTAIEHSTSDGVTRSVGYLCGIDKFADRASERIAGPASSYGRQGTFLGAKLGVAF